ncbi:hypothetical protein K402DRAFT_409781 [Aulographum hederae CBS 113979]|uniref:Roadblock/LAMTOR2 domain-containing protein n=1 Tax=Aulographum hederae CBS 113979 TaxID=1176131 RepID=A0A6G1HF17_9PEZI|nr:hypothetical protein K402DRAFT_409781 [Aulographum hederae CBS 113979]
MAHTAPDETLALLTRIGQKPGVQSTLILSRETGAIVRTSGLVANDASANPNATLPPAAENGAEGSITEKKSGLQSAEELARLVWGFVNAAGTMINGLDENDEMKLLRLRTKKNELVIVPDSKYLLVVVHDTPPA